MRPQVQLPKVHPELEGFNVFVNQFGEIQYTFSVEKLNLFLNRKVVDGKLKNRLGFKSDHDDDTVEFMY